MKYGVMLSGENFELDIDGKAENYGFVTTRYVKANDLKEAENLAVQLIKQDQYLISAMVENSDKAPMIYLEEIFEAKWWKRLGGKGYTFYRMKSDSNT